MTVRSEGSRACRAFAVAVLTLAAGAAAAKERVVQLAEDTAVRNPVESAASPLRAAPPTRICEPGAKWIRLGFKELVLDAYDSLVVTSSEGDSYTFEGKHWNDRAFHTRALRGERLGACLVAVDRVAAVAVAEIRPVVDALAAQRARVE